MSEAAGILVVILSIFLAFFLILASVLVILLIKVTREIESMTATAKNAAERFGGIAATISKVTSPALIAKIILSYLKKFKKHKEYK